MTSLPAEWLSRRTPEVRRSVPAWRSEHLPSTMGEDWCFLLEAAEAEQKVFEVRASNTSQQLWLDSACFDHVCGPRFAPHVELRPVPTTLASTQRITAANGQELERLGVKTVRFISNEGVPFSLEFIVPDVGRPHLSAGRLVSRGFDLNLLAVAVRSCVVDMRSSSDERARCSPSTPGLLSAKTGSPASLSFSTLRSRCQAAPAVCWGGRTGGENAASTSNADGGGEGGA